MKTTRFTALTALLLMFTLASCCPKDCEEQSATSSTSQETPQVASAAGTLSLSAPLPIVGEQAPDFQLCDANLTDIELSSLKGKTLVLNIFPSIDTPTCAQSVRKFNEIASSLEGTLVLCISKDLPFAMSRFCGAEDLLDVLTLSGFRSSFGADYGVEILDGGLKGLYARSIIVLNPEGEVVYTELVPDISNEPNYPAVLEVLKNNPTPTPSVPSDETAS